MKQVETYPLEFIAFTVTNFGSHAIAFESPSEGSMIKLSIEQQSKQLGIKQLFVLTTRTAHWFRERGYTASDIKKLPVKRKSLYNYQRQSKMFAKTI